MAEKTAEAKGKQAPRQNKSSSQELAELIKQREKFLSANLVFFNCNPSLVLSNPYDVDVYESKAKLVLTMERSFLFDQES
jgi:hypothetical protein